MKMLQQLKRRTREARDSRRGWFAYEKEKVYFPPASVIRKIYREGGAFEPHVTQVLVGLAKARTHVFDVGANIGLMALSVLARHQDVSVISLEPGPAVYKCLERTCRESRSSERWTTLNKAASDVSGYIEFNECIDGNDAFSGLQNTGRGGRSQIINVPAVRLDDVWRGVGQPPVSVVKVDVEGAELQVLRGAADCIAINRCPIVLEWWPPNFQVYGAASGDLINFAQACDYRIFEVTALTEIGDVCTLDLCHLTGKEDFLLMPR